MITRVLPCQPRSAGQYALTTGDASDWTPPSVMVFESRPPNVTLDYPSRASEALLN